VTTTTANVSCVEGTDEDANEILEGETRPRVAPQRTGNCPGGHPPEHAKVQVERPKDVGGARKPNEWLRRVDER